MSRIIDLSNCSGMAAVFTVVPEKKCRVFIVCQDCHKCIQLREMCDNRYRLDRRLIFSDDCQHRTCRIVFGPETAIEELVAMNPNLGNVDADEWDRLRTALADAAEALDRKIIDVIKYAAEKETS
jgi:hypothetical protein